MATNESDSDTESNVSKRKSDALNNMTEEQIDQHLSYCLKLDAENKINIKNAFGLHAIDIMRHRVQRDTQDLQAASLSLQASSKIYASRVDALYKETSAFHNQLQTIVSNEKVVEDKDNDGNDDDMEERPKERRAKSKQSYISSEDNLTLKSESCYKNTMPHANFIAIKSAFAASRTAPKLLERLALENDSCKLSCTTALPCYNPTAPMPVVDFSYPLKGKNLIQKIGNIRPNLEDLESASLCSDGFAPPISPPNMNISNDNSFILGSPPVPEQQDSAVEDIIDKFSVLDITADVLVKDLSLAIVDGNTVDRNRLPPNSALKRVLTTADRTRVGKMPVKVQKKKAPKVPFFKQERVTDKSVTTKKKGRRTKLTDKEISKWDLKGVTDGSMELFSTIALGNDVSNINPTVTIQDIFDPHFDEYFCKESQVCNEHRRKRSTQLIRPSSFGLRINSDNFDGMGSENSNCFETSFQNLSLQNSPARSDDYDAGDNMMPPGDDDDSFVLQAPILNRRSMNGFFEDDLQSVMVTPPEIAQPITMKFDIQPITLSTEKVKNAIWSIVEKEEEVLLSEVHKELKKVFEGENLPVQYLFTTLLMLANEKCLLLENISSSEIRISKDVPE